MALHPDTIYALSTPLGPAGRSAVAVVRVSGPHAFDSLDRLTPNQKRPDIRKAQVRLISDPITQKPIDAALVLMFKGPSSFTGEDCVEYHVHGGISIVQALMAALSRMEGHRMAMPGEFTRRGFEHGKFDLTEAEAIADLIHAETEAQRIQALDQLSGGLEELYSGWSDRLKHILALMEADLDFSDQDLPDDILLKLRPNLNDIAGEMAQHLNDGRRGERLRTGFFLTLMGAPNVGKSSILNRLALRDVAIVSPLAGTTRDVIESHLDIGGYPFIVADTAGLREHNNLQTGHDAIEQIGMERARDRAQQSDIILHIIDATNPDTTLPISDDQYGLLSSRIIRVINKCDAATINSDMGQNAISISAKTGDGFDDLLRAITQKIEQDIAPASSRGPSLTRARHREALTKAHEALLRVAEAYLPELAAEDVRLALRHVGSITGRVDVEDLLDMIFRDFCIGK